MTDQPKFELGASNREGPARLEPVQQVRDSLFHVCERCDRHMPLLAPRCGYCGRPTPKEQRAGRDDRRHGTIGGRSRPRPARLDRDRHDEPADAEWLGDGWPDDGDGDGPGPR